MKKTKPKKSAAAGRALTPSARRLVAGLEAIGVTFDLGYIDTFSIGTNPGQGMMNKAAGEIGPTWWLGVNGYRDRKRIYDAESRLKAEWNGAPVSEIESHMPLAWILKHPPAEWELADKEYGVVEVMVGRTPPSWK